MIDNQSFFDLVVQMRDKQKLFFKNRGSVALSEARELERKVDEMITGIVQTKLL